MPTTKHRINITTDKQTEKFLSWAAERDNMPVATKAAELLRIALELEEDEYFGKIATERLAMKNVKYVPHELAWK